MTGRADVATIISRYATKGIILDANLLLVYFIGQYKPTLIGKVKRTEAYTLEHYTLLASLMRVFKIIVTTPSILTEVSNLSRLHEPDREGYFSLFRDRLLRLDERYVKSSEIAEDKYWSKLGLTDCGIRIVADGEFGVLTADVKLWSMLLAAGVDAINFNHLRQADWQLLTKPEPRINRGLIGQKRRGNRSR